MRKCLLVLCLCILSGCVSDIQGRPYDEQRKCWRAFQSAGLRTSLFSGCDQDMPIAVDEDGELWLFTSGCLPDGYELADHTKLDPQEVYPGNLCDKR